MSQTLLTIVGGVGVIASIFAATFWFWASVLKVPDNIDTFIPALQEISQVNAWGAGAASVAGICAAIIWLAALLK
jgi:hypothetical protein